MIQLRGLLLVPVLLVCAAATSAAGEAGDKIPDLGSRRELFVDRFLIDKLHGTELRLHAPRAMGPVLHLNKPWEGPQCAYTTVLKDKDLYRMYYRGHTAKPEREFTCYAESRDGVTWTRPELGLVEVEGSKKNNLILGGLPECHNFAPFLDTRPGIPADQRYKALGGPAGGLTAWTSADGLRWQKMRDEPVISKKQVLFKHRHLFDSQNVAFWSETEKCYVCYFRIWDGVRRVGRTTSADFIHWQPAVLMEQVQDRGDGPKPVPDEHIYTTATTPYYRAPHLYLALPSRFMDGQDALTQEEIKRLDVDPTYRPVGSGFNDVPFMSTRGGGRYDRTFLEAFIRPGPGAKNWTSRANYPASGIVPSPDNPDELYIYLDRHVGYASAHIARYVLRTDGFISVHAPHAGGEMVTRPFRFQGGTLALNVATSAVGSVRVEIQDAQGKPIPGHTLADSKAIVGDAIDRVATWARGNDVSALAGRPIRLRLVMKDADVYALQFANPAK